MKKGKYQHYKGNFYEVLEVAIHSETQEELVIYKMLYSTPHYPFGTVWARPKRMFIESVQIDGKSIPRFKFIE